MKYAILGSCVTRDSVDWIDESNELVFYQARTSIISLMSESLNYVVESETMTLKRNFEKKMILDDLYKNFWGKLDSYRPDVLIIDFIDERFDIFCLNNTYFTRSNYLHSSGLLENGLIPEKRIKRNTQEAHDLFKKSLLAFISKIRLKVKKIILHKALYAEKYSLNNELKEFDEKDMLLAQEANQYLNDYYTTFENNCEFLESISIKKELVYSDYAHKWGQDFFHFGVDYYKEAGTLISKSFSNINATEDHVFKFKNRYLIYALKRNLSSKKLIITFSGLDSVPGFCRMSYFSFQNNFKDNIVHVMDNYGAHGSYLLSLSNDKQIQNATLELIKMLQRDMQINPDDIYFIGTSKGATTALLFSMIFGSGQVIIGEPQIKLGDFLYQQNWEACEWAKSIAYVLTGRIDYNDKESLNLLVTDIINRYSTRYRGKITVLYGKKTAYYENHIQYLENILEKNNKSDILKLESFDFFKHEDIVEVFLDYVSTKFQ